MQKQRSLLGTLSMPIMKWPKNKKSAICKIANDTLINSVKLCSTVAKLDTDMDIIAEFRQAVNENERF